MNTDILYSVEKQSKTIVVKEARMFLLHLEMASSYYWYKCTGSQAGTRDEQSTENFPW